MWILLNGKRFLHDFDHPFDVLMFFFDFLKVLLIFFSGF